METLTNAENSPQAADLSVSWPWFLMVQVLSGDEVAINLSVIYSRRVSAREITSWPRPMFGGQVRIELNAMHAEAA